MLHYAAGHDDIDGCIGQSGIDQIAVDQTKSWDVAVKIYEVDSYKLPRGSQKFLQDGRAVTAPGVEERIQRSEMLPDNVLEDCIRVDGVAEIFLGEPLGPRADAHKAAAPLATSRYLHANLLDCPSSRRSEGSIDLIPMSLAFALAGTLRSKRNARSGLPENRSAVLRPRSSR